MTPPFFFNKHFRLSAAEKTLFLDCADKATALLKRNQKKDSFWWPGSGMRLLGGLATYAFLLRHIAAGRRVRYFAPFHPAGCMAAFLGHAEVLHIFETHGVPLEALSWSWRKPNVLDFAVIGRNYALVRDLLKNHPSLVKKEWGYDAVAYCARYGTIPILRLLKKAGAPLDNRYWGPPDSENKRQPDGTPFFLAVAKNRRNMVRELIRQDALPDWQHTSEYYPARCGSSLLSLAVKHGDYALVDWLAEKGWLHPDMKKLPLWSDALQNLVRFQYLCQKFPKEDYKSVVRNGDEVVLSNTSEDVLSFAWDGQVPASVQEKWTKRNVGTLGWRPGDSFPDDDGCLEMALNDHPEELIRLEREQPGRFRKMLLEKRGDRYFSPAVYLFRLAAEKGIEIFRSVDEKIAFLERAHSGVLSELLPHLEELGFPPASDDVKRRGVPRIREASRDPLVVRLWEIGKSRWKELRRVLDDPSFNPNIEVTEDWPLLLEVARHGSPRLFDTLVLRGADPYESDSEGDTAMETANPKLTTHLVRAFGMSPNHQSYAGISSMTTAIWHNDLGRVKALVRTGFRINQQVWEEASALHMAILDGHDEISRFLIRHGAVNRDLSGRVRPVEPWMVGLKNRLPGKGVSATLLDRGTSRKWQDVPRGVAFAEVAPQSRTRKRGSRSR